MTPPAASHPVANPARAAWRAGTPTGENIPPQSAGFPPPPGKSVGHHQQRARRVLDHLHASLGLGQGVTLAQAARVACMSPGAFSRWFHQKFGITFQEHLVALRVARACELLAATNDKITHVAMASGFRNLSNFNRLFLRHTGRRPSHYRVQSRSAASPAPVPGIKAP